LESRSPVASLADRLIIHPRVASACHWHAHVGYWPKADIGQIAAAILNARVTGDIQAP